MGLSIPAKFTGDSLIKLGHNKWAKMVRFFLMSVNLCVRLFSILQPKKRVRPQNYYLSIYLLLFVECLDIPQEGRTESISWVWL